MFTLSRRDFLGMAGLTVATGLLDQPFQRATPSTPPRTRLYQGVNLSDWVVVVGDGIYAAPGEPAVNPNDIATDHTPTYSELRANILLRRIMAHDITYKQINADDAFRFVHTCKYKFRLPYLPSTGNADLNGQTLEGGVFVWDGGGTRLDYGAAFHWLLNPWMSNVGEIACWRDTNGGEWRAVGQLALDLNWHEITIIVDFQRQTTSMVIDGVRYPSCFTALPKPTSWGTETAARFQAEIVSIYPEPTGVHMQHKAQFKDWVWTWEPASTCQVFLPAISQN